MTKTRTTLLLAVALVVLGVASGYWYWTTTPGYSLQQIKKATDDHDLVLFKKHVDVDGLVSKAIDDFMASEMERQVEKDGVEAFGAALGQGFIQLFKPRFVEAVTNAVERKIERGDAFSNEDVDSDTKDNFDLAWLQKTDLSILGAAFAIRREGKTAYFSVFFTPDDAEPYDVKFLLRDLGGYWQVAEISNLKELLKEKARRHAVWVAERNKEIIVENEHIRESIAQLVKIIKTYALRKEDEWGIRKTLLLGIEGEAPKKNVVSAKYRATILTDSGESARYLLNHSEIERVQVGFSGGWSVDLNMFDENDSKILNAKEKIFQMEIEIVELTLEDGTVLETKPLLTES